MVVEILTTAINANNRAIPSKIRIGMLLGVKSDRDGCAVLVSRGARCKGGQVIGRVEKAMKVAVVVIAAGRNSGPVLGLSAVK